MSKEKDGTVYALHDLQWHKTIYKKGAKMEVSGPEADQLVAQNSATRTPPAEAPAVETEELQGTAWAEAAKNAQPRSTQDMVAEAAKQAAEAVLGATAGESGAKAQPPAVAPTGASSEDRAGTAAPQAPGAGKPKEDKDQ